MAIDTEKIFEMLRNLQYSEIVQIGEPAVPGLIEALKDSDGNVRGSAAWVLGFIKDPRAVAGLIEALKDSDRDVRTHAAWGLGKIGDARAVPALIETLMGSDRGVRNAAAWGLGKIKDPRAVDTLIEALKDSDWNVRNEAARALGEISIITDVDLSSVMKALKEFVDSAKGKEEKKAAMREAGKYYAKIAEAARKSKSGLGIGKDGESLEGETIKAPRGNKDGLFRSASSMQPIARPKRAVRIA